MSTKYDMENTFGQSNDELVRSNNFSEKDNLQLRSELINLAEQLKTATSNEEENLFNLCTRREDILKQWNVEKETLLVSAALLNLAITCIYAPKIVDNDYIIFLFSPPFKEKRQIFQSAALETNIVELDHAESIENWKRHIRDVLKRNQQDFAAEKVKIDASLNSSRLEIINAIVQCQSAINFMKFVEKEKDNSYCDLLQNLRKHFDQKALKRRQDFEQWRLEMIQRSNKEIKIMHEELEEQLKVEVQQAEQEMYTETQSQIDLSGLVSLSFHIS
jgi:hypothetical protein